MSKEKQEAFDKISDYIGAELKASLKDYEFLTKINEATTTSFKDYNAIADKIGKNINRINENQMAKARLDNLAKAIDEVDQSVSSLESLAYRIDSYSQRLEESYIKLQQTPSSTPSSTPGPS